MNQKEFEKLSKELREITSNIPLKWGERQNDKTDSLVSNIFDIKSYDDLESKISHLPESKKMYFKRRWYILMHSKCDEYLFYKMYNVIKNPKENDYKWDVNINQKYVFDIKGTKLPYVFSSDVNAVISTIKEPNKLVDYLYDNQSTGRRYHFQNRVFIIHHSLISRDRELYLRNQWELKEEAYKMFCNNIDNVSFISSHNVTAALIFILEDTNGKIFYHITGLLKQ